MNKIVRSIIGIFLALLIVGITLSVIVHLVKLAINIAIIGAVGFGIYYIAKKSKLIK
jgi:uncharacterized membrane-anchored protein